MKNYWFSLIIIIVCLVFTAPFFLQLGHVRIEDNVDYFHDKNNPDIKFYDEFKKIFGNDEFFIIAFKKEDIFTAKNLNTIKNLTNELEKINGIRKVKSLSNIEYSIGEEEFFIVRKFLETIPETSTGLSELKSEAVSNPLFEKNFISKDGRTTAVIVYVSENKNDSSYRKRIISKCRSELSGYTQDTGDIYIGGWTITNYYLSHYMQKDLKFFIPATYIFIVCAVFLIFRNLWLVVLSFINISMCMICTMGLFYYLDISINNVTTIIPPLVMALALCDTVHIFSYLNNFYFEEKNQKKRHIFAVLKKLFLPCFLTTFTTAVGFSSLYVSEIPPIKDFAKIATIGMVFEFAFSFTLLPALLLIIPFEKQMDKFKCFNFNKLLDYVSDIVVVNYRSIILGGIIVFSVSLYFSLSLTTETNVIDYFKKNSEIQIGNKFIKENLAGLSTFDISIKANQEDSFKNPEFLDVIEKIQNYIKTINGVDKTISFNDFLKDMNQSFHNENIDYFKIPESRQMVSQYLLIYDSEDLKEYVNSTFDHVRISVRISSDSTKEQKEILKKISNYIEKINQAPFSVKITGRVLNDVNMIDSLVKSQLSSLFLASFIIISIMFIILKSIKIGLLSIIPNILPILINFGIMGFFGIPLNAATALISAVALGIAVDDTIHFLTAYLKYVKLETSVPDAVKRAIKDKGMAIISSSFILSIGFGTLLFSSFVPSIYFGLLCTIIMVTAVIGDLFFLPSLILLTDRIKNNKGDANEVM